MSAVADILPLLERVLKVTKDLLIICDDCDGQALATLAVNKLRGTINVVAVKGPGFGDRRKESLGDIAALTGGVVISDELGRRLDFGGGRGSGTGAARRRRQRGDHDR